MKNKNKWIIFGMLLAIGMVFVSPQNVQAAVWAQASIDQVGQDKASGVVILTSTKGTFTHQWFILNPENNKAMLAVALTAQSLGMNLQIQINNDGKTIDRIRVSND